MGQETSLVYLVLIGHDDEPFKVADVYARRESAQEFTDTYNTRENAFGFRAWILQRELK